MKPLPTAFKSERPRDGLRDGLRCGAFAWTVGMALVLSACGGNDQASENASTSSTAASGTAGAELASGVTTLELDTATLPDSAANLVAEPSFHAAPVELDEPDDSDALNHSASASRAVHLQRVPQELAGLSTRGLTLQGLQAAQRTRSQNANQGEGAVAPLAGSTAIATYTPAQIRAAYGLPSLPAAGSSLTAAQAAQLGAGQTIYIVDAMHNPNTIAELAAFNAKFGLPTCATKAIAATAALPVAAASNTACEISVVYNTTAGGMTAAAPAYDSGWAMEITLDVQWAHATAPLARIVVIEAASASLNDLLGAVKLANAMGPGVVSMSFGANEGNYTASVDAAFAGTNMTYLAATGDNGASVSWPSVSSKVIAVGGTTLSYSGNGARSEVVWTGTGGGTSGYTATPSYQASGLPGVGSVARRTVADVAFNADPSSGQYIAVQAPGASSVSWMSVGGTSLSTPQWAGVVAIANAMRAQNSKAVLGATHTMLYGQIGAVAGTYAAAFSDIKTGSNGTCAACAAKTGYDPQTGLGTPNVTALLNSLSGATTSAVAPVVTGAAISGETGSPLSFTVAASAPNAVTYTLGGAPAGMTINTAGVVSWPVPVVGSYAVTVTAKDSKTALSGQGIYKVTVTAPKAPSLVGTTINGKPGVALSFNAAATAAHAVAYTLNGPPAGMVVSSAGVVSWPSPVIGKYTVTVNARDIVTGLTGQGIYTVQISQAGPVITAAAISGTAGKAVSGSIVISDPGASWLQISIGGAPQGMSFTASGLTITANWPSAVAGNYNLKVTVLDSAGLSASATVPITIK